MIFISDYENYLPNHEDSIKVYSIGEDKHFNKYCDAVFLPKDRGIKDILNIISLRVGGNKKYERL